MGKFDGLLLVSDFDDTFITGDLVVPPENLRALNYFTGEGGTFTIATGRAHPTFAPYAGQVPFNAPVILSNGASIYDFAKEESLWLKFLPKRAPVHIAKLCAAFPELGFEAYHQDEVYAFRPNVITYRHLTRCRLRGRRRDIEDMPTPWLKVILQHPDTAVLQQAQEYLLSRWSDIYEATFSNRNLLEVTAKGANKGFSVLWLAQHLGVEQKDLYCIGNGLNDIPMLSVSAQSFAPANSYPEVREVADLVLPSCDESCVARMIEVLEERYKDR